MKEPSFTCVVSHVSVSHEPPPRTTWPLWPTTLSLWHPPPCHSSIFPSPCQNNFHIDRQSHVRQYPRTREADVWPVWLWLRLRALHINVPDLMSSEQKSEPSKGGQFRGLGLPHMLVRTWKGRHEKLICRFLFSVWERREGIGRLCFFNAFLPRYPTIPGHATWRRGDWLHGLTRGQRERGGVHWGGTTAHTSTCFMCQGSHTKVVWLTV